MPETLAAWAFIQIALHGLGGKKEQNEQTEMLNLFLRFASQMVSKPQHTVDDYLPIPLYNVVSDCFDGSVICSVDCNVL